MNYTPIHEYKVIIFWSHKSGSSTILNLINYYTRNENRKIHGPWKVSQKINKNNVGKDYKIYSIIRNPYERLISTIYNRFINDNINIDIEKRWMLQHLSSCNPTFEDFVSKLNKCGNIHIRPQTELDFRLLVELQKSHKIEFLDVSELEKLNSDLSRLSGKEKYENIIKNETSVNFNFIQNAHKLTFNQIKELKPSYQSFFTNPDIKKKIYEFYKKDFEFLKSIGFNYDI